MANKKVFRGRLIKILADSSNKRLMLILLFLSLILLLALNITAAYLVPEVLINIEGLDKCPGNFSTFRGFCHKMEFQENNKWISYISNIGPKNQFLMIGGEAVRDQAKADREHNFELDFKVEIKSVELENGDETELSNINQNLDHKMEVKCNKNQIYCANNIFLLIYPKEKVEVYKIEIEINIPMDFKDGIKSIYFFANMVDPKYTNFLLILRYTCLVISVFFGILYFKFYFSIENSLLTFEHKFIFLLSICLIFFNDPFYALTILKSEFSLTLLSNFFVIGFISILILFWIVMIQRMYKESVMITSNLLNKKNIFFSFIIFCLLMSVSMIANVFSRFYPGFHLNAEYPLVFEFLIFVVFGILIFLAILFIYSTYKIFISWNKLIPRHKFFFLFSFYFIVVLFFMIANGLYQSYESSGVKILMLFLLNNFYVIMLQILWRFSFIGKKEYKEFLKENKYSKNSLDEKKRLGLNYFEENLDIEIYRKNDQNKTEIEIEAISKSSKNSDLSMISKNSLEVDNITNFDIEDEENKLNISMHQEEKEILNKLNNSNLKNNKNEQFDMIGNSDSSPEKLEIKQDDKNNFI